MTMTAATVVTSILEYNHTTITSLSTILLVNASSSLWSSVPPGLVSGSVYYSTVLADQTATTTGWEDQIILNPTPFIAASFVLYASGHSTTISGTPTCQQLGFQGHPDPMMHMSKLSTPYVFIPTPTPAFEWIGPTYASAPKDILDVWIAQQPDITKDIPDLTNCEPFEGPGEPTIHIPVSKLTDHSTTTIKVDGGGGGNQPGPAPEPTPSMTPEPIVTPEPSSSFAEPASNPAPEPSAESSPATVNPPQSTKGDTGSPPASPGGDTNSSPATSRGQAPPAGTSAGVQNPLSSQPAEGDQPPASTGGNMLQVSNLPILPGPTPPVVLVPAPTGSAVVLPGGTTLTPGQTTTVSGIEIIVPTAQPTEIILPGGETLTPGITTTVSGFNIVVPTNAPSVIVVDGTTQPAPTNFVVIDGTTVPVQQPAPTNNALTITEAPISSIIIGSVAVPITPIIESSLMGIILPNGDTLLPGSTTTINDETIVLSQGPSGTNIQIIDSSTTEYIALYTPTTLSSKRVETEATETSTGKPAEHTGAASLQKPESWLLLMAAGIFGLF